MENEINTGDALMDAMGGEPTVAPEPIVEEPVAEEQVPAQEPQYAPQVPQFDPNLLVGALDNVHSRLDSLQNPAQPQPEPTQDEMIMRELAEKMGLTKMQDENNQLKQALDQTKQQTEKMNQYIEQQQISAEQDKLLSKFDGVSKDMVYAKLDEIAQNYGQEFALSLNNTQGWNMLLSTQIQKPQSSPDPIVSTEAGNTDFAESATERINSGSAQKGDIGSLLASFV